MNATKTNFQIDYEQYQTHIDEIATALTGLRCLAEEASKEENILSGEYAAMHVLKQCETRLYDLIEKLGDQSGQHLNRNMTPIAFSEDDLKDYEKAVAPIASFIDLLKDDDAGPGETSIPIYVAQAGVTLRKRIDEALVFFQSGCWGKDKDGEEGGAR
jgi:hypothetical protein